MSKLWYITKNNLKLIFRKPVWNAVIVLGAVLVVAALSGAFHTLLDAGESAGKFRLGYRMTSDSSYAPLEKMIMDGFRENGIESVRYDDESLPQTCVESGEVDVFVDFSGADYHIYGNGKKEVQARLVSFVLFNTEEAVRAAQKGDKQPAVINTGVLETEKTSSAENYYGIIEIVYFVSVNSVLLCLIFWTEQKNKIRLRLQLGAAGPAARYFGKLLACVISSFVLQVVLGSVLITSLYEVTIGKPLLSFLILFLETVAFAAFGMILFLLVDNMAVSIGLLFMVNWFMGLFGGSFETYMYSSIPENFKRLSPIYYVNRSLVELSVKGESAFVKPCILFMGAMAAVCMVLGLFITSRKKEA